MAEIEDMRKEIETFPKRLEASIKETRQETEKILQKDFAIQKQMAEQQWSSEKMMLEAKINNLQELMKTQSSEIISIKKSLADANQRAQDLATAVIENAGYKKADETSRKEQRDSINKES